jgi:putative transposase
MVGVLKQAEVGVPVADGIRKAGISEQTFYRLKKQCSFGSANGMPVECYTLAGARIATRAAKRHGLNLRARIGEIAQSRVRYGYRKILV